jgi:hypothetical protein
MPIDVRDNYPCSICEDFSGRHPWARGLRRACDGCGWEDGEL